MRFVRRVPSRTASPQELIPTSAVPRPLTSGFGWPGFKESLREQPSHSDGLMVQASLNSFNAFDDSTRTSGIKATMSV